MRLALILIALFTLRAEAALADVFVPADPPVLRSAQCVASGGDVVAAGTDLDKPVRLSVGGGGWREVAGLRGCPSIAAAGDGTLALVGASENVADRSSGGGSLVVREPGGAFGAPVALGGDSTSGAPEVAVAVAPGGWVAVAWIEGDIGLTVLVRRPDGSETRTLLEPSAGELDISNAQLGIDASGDVTVVWSRFDRRAMRLRVARGVAGAAPVPGADLPSPTESFGDVEVAVAPAGGSLVAWTDADGVHAVLDGQQPAIVAPPAPGAQLAAGLADDGTALLVSMVRGGEIVATERVAGAWLQPRVLSPARAVDSNPSSSSEEAQLDVQLVLAPGGRAAVAWSALPRQIVGVVGTVGGRWSAATRLSSATRTAYALDLAADAGGTPRALWSEAGLGVRGASPAVAPLDGSPPVVTARLPTRAAPTADGNISVTARVRCSEACDARLAFTGGENDRGNVSRAIAAGGTETVRLRASDELQYGLVVGRAARRLRLALLVTDRAGNLVRRSGVVRVRVLKPPIRTLKVPPGRKFGMETPAGDRAVARLVNDMIETIARGHVSSGALSKRYARSIRAIARKFGPDYTYSDEVGTAIYDALWIPLARTHHDVGYVLQG